jgi:hypothetical protein
VSPVVLLASDAGSVVELHVGERFVLLLGQYTGTDWQVRLSDPGVLQRVGSDGQGVYQAAMPGETELTVIGDPTCRRARPACGAPSRAVRFVVRVQERPSKWTRSRDYSSSSRVGSRDRPT